MQERSAATSAFSRRRVSSVTNAQAQTALAGRLTGRQVAGSRTDPAGESRSELNYHSQPVAATPAYSPHVSSSLNNPLSKMDDNKVKLNN